MSDMRVGSEQEKGWCSLHGGTVSARAWTEAEPPVFKGAASRSEAEKPGFGNRG